MWTAISTRKSLEEAAEGFCTRVEIMLLQDGRVRIRDNGRGLPLSEDIQADRMVLNKILAGKPVTNAEYSQMGDLVRAGMQTVNSLCGKPAGYGIPGRQKLPAGLCEGDCTVHLLAKKVKLEYPYLRIENANVLIRSLRTIKQACEIEDMREAEKITRDGIVAMMKASRPGMYEYQYKAEFDYALGQHGPQGPAFPSIISAGKNNFCIHYYQYKGQARDGDMNSARMNCS
ncbi:MULTISPECIES: M24 family metallopeptidase [Eisenbergiella]|uniref:Xaa-Pro aminopeptidase n=1 Tax=Eisenbergiella porci TaxID=2652274 RepID=A0A6N7W4P7_9FIRM|nr:MULTISPECIES: M24 family metallopeptidase [Eisenbergiella]MDY2653052.1 M24 family metallopeptidase [Eisenbergiella porci]MSS90209.1 M24 family metallopeptidase [Eisenbergiella porci]